MLEHRRTLDLRQGVLWREWRHQDSGGRITRVTLPSARVLADRHVLLQSVVVTAENYVGPSSWLPSYRTRRAGRARPAGPGRFAGVIVSRQDGGRDGDGIGRAPGRSGGVAIRDPIGQRGGALVVGGGARRDGAAWIAWSRSLRPATSPSRRRLPSAHVATIRDRGVPAVARPMSMPGVVSGTPPRCGSSATTRRSGRCASPSIISWRPPIPTDEHVSIGARGLTGEAYRGHVFWDTEIYMLPFYMFTDPPAARGAAHVPLSTRSAPRGGRPARTAIAARSTPGNQPTPVTRRRRGRSVGPTGGWSPSSPASRSTTSAPTSPTRSGSTGGRPADDAFWSMPAPRFSWRRRGSGRAARGWSRTAATTSGVIGPDEYHETVDDNAYTNVMAHWNLERAADTAAILQRERPPTGNGYPRVSA